MDAITKRTADLAPHPGRTMGDLAEIYLKSLDVKENTRGTYRRFLRIFARWTKANPPGLGGRYTRETILAYKKDLRDRGFTAASISSAIGAIRGFFAWADENGYYPNIAKGVKGEKRNRKRHLKDAFTKDQALMLLDSIDRRTIHGARDFAIINLMIRAGLRTVEVCRAKIGDISNNGQVEILRVQGKGKSEMDEIVLLTPAALGPIRDYLARRGPAGENEPLFASHSHRNAGSRITPRQISGTVKSQLKEIGILSRRLTAHSCRHSAVTFALLGGATIQEAQVLARHADINTTLIYSHNIDRANIAQAPEFKVDAFLR